MAVRTTEIARTFGSAPYEWFKPIVPAILAVVLPWARFCTSQQVDSAAHCFHMNAAHAGGPLLAGQHRAQRVFAAFFLRRRTVLLQCDRGGSGGKGVRAR